MYRKGAVHHCALLSSNAVFSLVTFYGATTNVQVTLPVYAPFVICELGVVMFNFTFDNSESHVP